jgi:hypothetical protein
MNETLGKTELSDVLTSLKQLVVDDAEAESVGTEFNKRLVLSPSLRIADDPVVVGDAVGAKQSLQDKILRLEELISHTEGLSDPDNAGQDGYAAHPVSGLPWEKVVDAALSDFETPVVSHAIHGEEPNSDSDPTTEAEAGHDLDPEVDEEEKPSSYSLDPVMLKALISEIIREELRGSLGENITSNIRKLVRGEIEALLATSKKLKSAD